MKKDGYNLERLSFNRKAVIASASITSDKNSIHCLTEVDINNPRKLIKVYYEQTGEKLSFTAYIVTCLVQTINEFPEFNSFIKGRNLVVLNDVTVSVLVEREIEGEKVPEPIGIQQAQLKSYLEVHKEIRETNKQQGEILEKLARQSWVRLMPIFLLKAFVRVADQNIRLAKRYGKVAVTSVGMFCKEASWFIPHGSATVLVTVGSISRKIVEVENEYVSREHLCLTVSFDHNIVDGAPASRFLERFVEIIKSGNILKKELVYE